MSVFVVSFRISDQTVPLGTYSERWESVNDAIKAQAVGRNYWRETTSFVALHSDKTTAQALATAIDAGSKFAASVDLLLVVNLSAKGYKILGNYSDKDIDAIMALR